jgi:hypothetical protein
MMARNESGSLGEIVKVSRNASDEGINESIKQKRT